MDHNALARAFDDVSGPLIAAGHGVIVRRTRSLLADGDVDAALAFVKEAGTRTPLMAFDTLHDALAAWQQAGSSASGLRRNGAWKAGIERGDRVADEIASLTDGKPAALLDRLITETRTAGAVELDEAGRATGPQAIGNIFGARETGSRPVVEATSNLVPRSLGLNEPVVSEEPPPLSAPESEAPPAPAFESAQVPVPPPAEEFTEPPTVQSDPPEMEELEVEAAAAAVSKPEPPPPAVDNAQPPAAVESPDESTASLWVGLAIVIAAIVLLIWYTNKS